MPDAPLPMPDVEDLLAELLEENRKRAERKRVRDAKRRDRGQRYCTPKALTPIESTEVYQSIYLVKSGNNSAGATCNKVRVGVHAAKAYESLLS
jgi:hypothetical protein